MNTKRVEELVGLSRQNIRYYEKEGLLTPNREEGNSYRDYSEEDIRRLKTIKMLRMLDMPLKEIERVLKKEVSLQEAVTIRQKEILEYQKQLQHSKSKSVATWDNNPDNLPVYATLIVFFNFSEFICLSILT